MTKNLNTENHLATINVLRDPQEQKSLVNDKYDKFMTVYSGFLSQFIARRLRRPIDDHDVVCCVQVFWTEQLEKMRLDKPNVWSQWDGVRSFRALLKNCCWKSTLKQLDIRRGTPDAYEAFREDLIDLVRRRVARPGVSDALSVNVPDYVREFLEYHSSRDPRPPRNPHKNRDPRTQDGVEDTTWWEDFREKCWRYIEWWWVRPDFPAWDYLVHRERLLGELRGCVDRSKLPDEETFESLVAEFLKHYGAQNLRVRRSNGASTTFSPLPHGMLDDFKKYVLNGEKWREKFAAKPHVGVEAVRKERPRRRWTVIYGLDENQVAKRSARRDDRADNGQPILHHEPGDDRRHGGCHESQTPEDRRFQNELMQNIIRRYLREHRGTPHAKLFSARALEPFANNLSKAPPYREIYERCGFPGDTEAEKLRAAELAWPTVQNQLKATLCRELNDLCLEPDQTEKRKKFVDEGVQNFYQFLEDVVRHFDLSQNAHQPSAQDDLRATLRQELNDRWPDHPRTMTREPWVEQKLGEFYQCVDDLVTYFDTAKNSDDSSAQDDLQATLRDELHGRWPEFPPKLPCEQWGEREIAEFYRLLADMGKYFEQTKKADDPAADDDFEASHRPEFNDRWPDAPQAMPSKPSVEQQVRDLHRFLGDVVRHFPLSQNAYDRSAQDHFRRCIRECFHPGVSTTSTAAPDLSKCSLGLIAVLLLEPGVRRSPEDRQREWGECLRTPLRALMNDRSAEAPCDEGDGEAAGADTPQQGNTPDAHRWKDRSFGDLIHDQQPDIEHLKQGKDALRSRYRQAGRDLDSDVLVAAYLAAIAAALVSTGEKITRKDDFELADDFRWLAGEEWIDPKTRQLAEQARQRLEKGAKGKGERMKTHDKS